MKILSLNVNKFSGQQKLKKTDAGTAKSICERITAYDPDIIILEEFDASKTAKEAADKCISALGQYKLFVPRTDVGNELECYRNYPRRTYESLTVCFIHARVSVAEIEASPDNWANIVKIKHKNAVILGVHMQYDKENWRALKDEYDKGKNNPLIMIGDFNTWELATGDAKKSYDAKKAYNDFFKPMLDDGAVDLCPRSIMTFEKEGKRSRIDHLLISPRLTEKVTKISVTVDRTFINDQLSDHAALIFEIDDLSFSDNSSDKQK